MYTMFAESRESDVKLAELPSIRRLAPLVLPPPRTSRVYFLPHSV